MQRLLWISLGGAIGTGARYLVGGWAMKLFGSGFPYGTFAVNLLGSFLLAVLMYLGTNTEWMSPTLRMAVTTGMMGGFTTYSTFSYETMSYMHDGAWSMGLLNIAVTVLVCLGASFLGLAVGRYMLVG